MAPSRITLVAHTHWDREWYQPFEVFRAHLVEMLDEALDELERDRRLSFTLDGQVSLVDDYLELRPTAEPRIRTLVEAGRLHVGPWYTQADTLLADGEALVRNLAFGLRRAELLGGAMRVGYMPDQFGHAAQLPQIFRSLGIDSAVLWRGVGPDRPPHAFRWVGPDGSEVTALWLQDGYGSGRRLPSDPQGFADAVERTLARLGDWIGEMPILFPVGDDHVRLATWLPDCAAALQARKPNVEVRIGGYHDHLPEMTRNGTPKHVVRGEMRSPAFSPVLAGVASARIREKQAAFLATTLLLRYSEPLMTMARLAGGSGSAAGELVRRAWKQLFHNQAHDSAAGCGVDAAHEDVKARYRWAEQLAIAARDQALAQIRVDAPKDAAGYVVAYNAGPRASAVTVETMVPVALLDGDAAARGPDGVLRPIQLLGGGEQRPIFEGEFPASELAQYLGGVDPRTPLFGKYLQGITATETSPGTVRLDVGLADTPVTPESLADDQKRVEPLLKKAERFKVLMHYGALSRPALVQGGPAPELSLVPIAFVAGKAQAGLPSVEKVEGADAALRAGPITVTALKDGLIEIHDAESGLRVRANDLIDDGDRGDLYHYDPVVPAILPKLVSATVTEAGPLRGRIVIEQQLDIPNGLTPDRARRGAEPRPTMVTTTVTLSAGSRAVGISTSFDNTATDHRVRALVHAPFRAERLDVDQGLAVVARPLDVSTLAGPPEAMEKPAPTGQHHRFVDISDGKVGVAMLPRGLPEHEVVREDGHTTAVALTLLRSVGWLSRGDLAVIDAAAGPILPTPAAQELGPHTFEYAVLVHKGDWQAGGVMAEARRFASPPMPVQCNGKYVVPPARALVDVLPDEVTLTGVHPAETGRGTVVRVVNNSAQAREATLRLGFPAREAALIDPLERELDGGVSYDDGICRLQLGPWQIATVLFRS
jgi:2-O-(6-phospho-alpha-D-mannosyl)-D-glycerate hydrolase